MIVDIYFFEFLIRPRLFWKLSGKDAVKIAAKDELNEI